ncbi:unnamed protein product [Arabis nemorensis]|uniref:Uncharacterized protein n=1 Tax=Arabis nemorensis TaxID=586526 RepID=A0A565BT04_9BRAS|nr:unnamed protein product [Arabis nemorensis]
MVCFWPYDSYMHLANKLDEKGLKQLKPLSPHVDGLPRQPRIFQSPLGSIAMGLDPAAELSFIGVCLEWTQRSSRLFALHEFLPEAFPPKTTGLMNCDVISIRTCKEVEEQFQELLSRNGVTRVLVVVKPPRGFQKRYQKDSKSESRDMEWYGWIFNHEIANRGTQSVCQGAERTGNMMVLEGELERRTYVSIAN